MPPIEGLLRSTVTASRRAIGLPPLVARLDRIEDKLDRLSQELSEDGTSRQTGPSCSYQDIMGYPRVPAAAPPPFPLESGLCRQGDFALDLPPYRDEPHLRLRIAAYDCTSIGLIIVRT